MFFIALIKIFLRKFNRLRFLYLNKQAKYLVLFTCAILFAMGSATAQNNNSNNIQDSIKNVQLEKKRSDSLRMVAQREKLLEEKRKRDSLILAEREKFKQEALERKRINDSIKAVTKARMDSLKTVRELARKQREKTAKYKNSKHYKDSVASVRQARLDSIKDERIKVAQARKIKQQKMLDSIQTVRKNEIALAKAKQQKSIDSIKQIQLVKSDSIKKAREVFKDSIAKVRKKRDDSLATVKKTTDKNKTKVLSDAEKQKEKLKAIHAKKQDSWSNQNLLKKPWSMNRRIYQNTVTRYNAYYNAKRKYKEALQRLAKQSKNNYENQISISEYDGEKASSLIGNDMDTVVKKCAFTTQIHDPRAKWFDDSYLLMGKAFYYKNDFENAITAFQFVINEYKKQKIKDYVPPTLNEIKFDSKDQIKIANEEHRTGRHILEHHPVRNDALLWLCKTYIAAKQYADAQSMVGILKNDPNFPDRLKGDLFIEEANLALMQNNIESAIEPLKTALENKNLDEVHRIRATYLLAQLYQAEDSLEQSNYYFNQLLKSNIEVEMEFFAKLNMAKNALKGASYQPQLLANLEGLVRDDRFAPWRDQSYLALGELLLSREPKKAIDYLEKSLENAKDNGSVKARAHSYLGNYYFQQKDFEKAKIAYDSTVIFGKNIQPPLKNWDEIVLRQEVLSDLVKYTNTIRVEDSLQTLSKMSEKEQSKVIEDYLKKQEKAQKEIEKRQEQEMSSVALVPNQTTKNNWYFYNNQLMQQGTLDFQQIWGKRPLIDNWRRSNSNGVFANNNNGSNQNDDGGDSRMKKRIKKYINELYHSQADFDMSDKKIIDAYYQLGLIYGSRLQDYEASNAAHKKIVNSYPQADIKPNCYYGLYRNYLSLNQKSEADYYKNLLAKDYSKSDFYLLIENPEYLDKQQTDLSTAIQFYDSTYNQFSSSNYTASLQNAIIGKTKFASSILQAKFDLIQAKSLAALQQFDSARVITEKIITSYPGSEEQLHAQEFLSYLDRRIGNLNTSIPSFTDSSSQKTVGSASNQSAIYTLRKQDEHLTIILITPVNGTSLGLKAGVGDYNTIKHYDKLLTTNFNMIDNDWGILSIGKFDNAIKATNYMNQLKTENKLFSNLDKANYKILIISSENFKELLKTRKREEYLEYFKRYY